MIYALTIYALTTLIISKIIQVSKLYFFKVYWKWCMRQLWNRQQFIKILKTDVSYKIREILPLPNDNDFWLFWLGYWRTTIHFSAAAWINAALKMTLIWNNAVLYMNAFLLIVSCSKLTAETQIQGVKYAQSQQ